MATTSLLKREIKFVSIISLCALLWTLTPDAFAVSGKNKNIMDPRLADFNSKLDMILQKLNHMEEPVQENIHDIILFVIFGIFVIFILDSIYRVGKMTL